MTGDIDACGVHCKNLPSGMLASRWEPVDFDEDSFAIFVCHLHLDRKTDEGHFTRNSAETLIRHTSCATFPQGKVMVVRTIAACSKCQQFLISHF